jgi:hypothetical protein
MHLTNNMAKNNDSPALAADAVEAGAPACGIEVTEEMIKAGLKEARLYDHDDPKEWEIAAVYEAMEKARRCSMGTAHR